MLKEFGSIIICKTLIMLRYRIFQIGNLMHNSLHFLIFELSCYLAFLSTLILNHITAQPES